MWRGAPKAITATAHKLAGLVYTMLQSEASYVDAGQQYYEQQYRARAVQNLKRKAQAQGFQLLPTQACNTTT
jgi:transposase